MANTDPVADTAGVVEQVWRLGREAGLLRRASRRRRHRRAARASGSPSSARWPTRAARVRVFSDDGNCVSDRAADAPRAGVRQGLRRRRSPSTRRSRGSPRARRCTRAQLSGAAGPGRAGPPSPRRRSSPATSLLAGHVGSRLHVCHVSTAGVGGDGPLGEVARRRRHRRGDAAPPAAHRRVGAPTYDPIFKVNPPLRTRRGRRGAAARPRRRHDRRGRHRPRPARRRGQGVRVGERAAFGMLGLETALVASSRRRWSRPGCSTGRASPTRMSVSAGPDRRARPARAADRGRRRPRTSCCSTPPRGGPSSRQRPRVEGAQHPVQRQRSLPGRVVATRSCAATADRRSDGKVER